MIREYIECALRESTYEKLEDGTFCGEISACPGTIAFGETIEECRRELEAALEDWLLSALRHGDALPVIEGIDRSARIYPRRSILPAWSRDTSCS